jgi:hypothetical protein
MEIGFEFYPYFKVNKQQSVPWRLVAAAFKFALRAL